MGADRIPIDQMDAGNIVAVAGLKDAMAGSTVSTDKAMESFEKITHYSEPVVTVAIEAKHMKDLPKLVEVLRTVAKADPSIQVEINQRDRRAPAVRHGRAAPGDHHLPDRQRP